MNGMSIEERVQEIKENILIEDIVDEFISLEEKGNRLVGKCFFCQSEKESFSVSPVNQLFYCYNCHTGGDVIYFLRNCLDLTFMEALERLEEKL